MTASIRLSARSAKALLETVTSKRDLQVWPEPREVTELRAALAKLSRSRPRKAAAQKVKTAKRKTRREETAEIRAAVMERADGYCEACPMRDLLPLELDHAFGRRGEQSHRTCWALCRWCHKSKTLNQPSAAEWLGRFISHCHRHGYDAEAKRARARLHFVEARAVAPVRATP